MTILDEPLRPDDTVKVTTSDQEAPAETPPSRSLGRVQDADLSSLDRKVTPLDAMTATMAAPTVAASRSSYVAPWKRARAPRRVDPYLAARLRQQVAIPYPRPPHGVSEAQQVALDAIDRFEEAVKHAEGIGLDAELEAQGNDAKVANAVRAGDVVPTMRRTDWLAEETVRRVAHEEAYKAAVAAVQAFGRAVEEGKPEWQAAVVAQIAPARQEAREALRVAARAVREWRSAVDAADRLAIEIGLHQPYTHQASEKINKHTALAGLAEIEKLVFSEDPVVSGDFLVRDDDDAKLVPPAWTRDALRRQAESGSDAARWALADIADAERQGRVAHDWANVLLGGGPSVDRL